MSLLKCLLAGGVVDQEMRLIKNIDLGDGFWLYICSLANNEETMFFNFGNPEYLTTYFDRDQ
jgi:hypothetical protein